MGSYIWSSLAPILGVQYICLDLQRKDVVNTDNLTILTQSYHFKAVHVEEIFSLGKNLGCKTVVFFALVMRMRAVFERI